MSSYVLVVLFLACAAAGVAEGQLIPESCTLPELSEKLQNFPLDGPGAEVSTCRDMALTFTQIDPEEYVNRQNEVYAALGVICSGGCLPAVAELVVSCYPSFRNSLGQACASSGVIPCWRGPIINNGSSVFTNCYGTINNQDLCSEECADSIVEIKSSLGCCVNTVFNTSVFGSTLEDLQVANGLLWDACGIQRTGFCPLPAVFNTVTVATTDTTTDTAVTAKGIAPTASILVLLIWLVFATVII